MANWRWRKKARFTMRWWRLQKNRIQRTGGRCRRGQDAVATEDLVPFGDQAFGQMTANKAGDAGDVSEASAAGDLGVEDKLKVLVEAQRE